MERRPAPGDELGVSPLADDIEGRPSGFVIPRQTLLFGEDLCALRILSVVGRDLSYTGYSYDFMHADSGDLIWRFDKHPIDSDQAESHLHLPPRPEQHIPFREVETDEVVDWVHRYLHDQQTPAPT